MSIRVRLVVAALALAVPLALSGCAAAEAPDFEGEGAEYYNLVWDKYGGCLDKLRLETFSYNPGGIDPRQIGTVSVSSEDAVAYFAVVEDVDDSDALILVPDSNTTPLLASVGC